MHLRIYLICLLCSLVCNEAAPTTEGSYLNSLDSTTNFNRTPNLSQHERAVISVEKNLFKTSILDGSNEGKKTSSEEVDDNENCTHSSLKLDKDYHTTIKSNYYETTEPEEFTTTDITTVLVENHYEDNTTDATTVQSTESSSSSPVSTSTKSSLDSEPANIENLSVNLADGLFI